MGIENNPGQKTRFNGLGAISPLNPVVFEMALYLQLSTAERFQASVAE
jgi:hypothetical protein